MAATQTDALLELFLARCDRLGVKVHRAALGGAEIARTVVEVLREEGVASAIVADDLGFGRDEIVAALAEAGVALNAGESPAAAEPAEAGVTRAAFGVAETGSICVAGNEPQPRLATMLPPVHVALLDRPAVYPTLDEAGAELERTMAAGTGGLRYASLVTGPSRTADVEKTLAVGVHGPRVVHVVLIDSL